MKKLNLKNRKWPSPPPHDERFKGEGIKGFLRLRADYEKSAFVSEGHVEVRRLGPASFVKPIPAGECAITALTRYKSGKIYGGTSGSRGHLFYYDPSPDADVVVDIGVVGEEMSVTSLVAGEKIYGATEGRDGGFLFAYSPCEVLMEKLQVAGKGLREIFDSPVEDQMFHSIVDPCHSAGKIEMLKKVSSDEGIACLAMDRKRDVIYGLTSKKGLFFVYSIQTGKLSFKGQVDPIREFSKKLVLDLEGNVYGAGCWGRLFRYSPDKGKIESLSMTMPSLKGREAYNRVDAWALDEATGAVYGGTIDGILFEFEPRTQRMICLGKPIDQMRTRALTVGNDGRVFGVGGEPGKCCHLFVYEPGSRQLRDLGMLLAAIETPWYGYEIACAATGRDGEIYFGENDRISNLFIYHPAIALRTPALCDRGQAALREGPPPDGCCVK
ncbi:MAG: hypothetical protein PHV34_13000 [Verrucomicrobiae bacterium]|nr:hypothetical protein [Verrucomicrobiae bacterium]